MLTVNSMEALVEFHNRGLTGRTEKTVPFEQFDELITNGLIASEDKLRFRPTQKGHAILVAFYRSEFCQADPVTPPPEDHGEQEEMAHV